MLDSCETTWAVLTTDGIVTRQPSYLSCVTLSVATSGDSVSVYEGRDATSGRKIFTIKALANRSVSFNLSKSVLCGRGIYVDFSTTGSEVTVVYTPTEYEDIPSL